MDSFKGILLCSDLDGTLRNSKGEISKENIEAIRYFCDNGGLFTLCTGRNPSHARALCEKGLIINTALIALNGAMIYDLEKAAVLYENPIDKAELFDVDKFIEENRQYISDVVFHSIETKSRYAEIGDDKLYKIVFTSKTAEASRCLRSELEKRCGDRFFITNSWPEGLELLAKSSTKGECLKRIRKHINCEITKTVCVGDYENDISMLKAADLSFAVGNAIPEVKTAADRVTASNNESALAKIIKMLPLFPFEEQKNKNLL